jgi:hypothetical protein
MSGTVTVFIPRLPRAGPWPWSPRSWTVSQLNAAIARDGFDMALDEFDTRSQVGTAHCTVGGLRTCFEYYEGPLRQYMRAVDEMREEDGFPYTDEELALVARHDRVVQLVLHWRPREHAAACITAASLARMSGGVALEEGIWRWYSGDEALAWARDADVKGREENWESGE